MKKKLIKIFIPILSTFLIFSIIVLCCIILLHQFNKYRINLLYSDFNSKYEEFTKIPGLDTTFVPQGITYSEEQNVILITGYCTNKSPSPIYVLDKDGSLVKKVTFTLYNGSDYKGHAGAIISYHDFVFISSGNIVYTLSLDTILQADNNSKISVSCMTNVEVSGASMFIYKEYLVVTEFYEASDYKTPESHHITYNEQINKALAFAYKLDETSKSGFNSEYSFAFSLPEKVQGILFYDNKFIISTSYGRFNDSYIYIYEENDLIDLSFEYEGKIIGTIDLKLFDATKASKKIKILPMSEGITIINNEVLVLFESGASKYKTTSKCSTDYIWNLKNIYE